jgi:hypothetical protein
MEDYLTISFGFFMFSAFLPFFVNAGITGGGVRGTGAILRRIREMDPGAFISVCSDCQVFGLDFEKLKL